MKNSIRYYCLAFLVAAILLPVNGLSSSLYLPAAQFEILTEVKSESSDNDSIPTRFKVEPSRASGDKAYIDFIVAETAQKIGRLVFTPGDFIEWRGAGASDRILQAEHLLIIPGFTVPVDVLPVNSILSSEDGIIRHEFRRQAGDRLFLARVEISARSVSSLEAEENGWLYAKNRYPENLYLISAINLGKDELLVRQLWAPGEDWWLYEETPFRRSWRIP